MADLVEFLTARYDEDELWARNREERAKDLYRILKGATAQIGADTPTPSVAHPQTNPATRALADLAAKRAIVALYQEALEWRLKVGAADETAESWGSRTKLAFVCRMLAAPYGAHPDFDPAWRIDD